ncbi:hypothetical protein OIM90_19275 [Streptomyces sp. AD16]|nr:hypothetical protein OIM90_19275 [Streptomyces sp. AD16]
MEAVEPSVPEEGVDAVQGPALPAGGTQERPQGHAVLRVQEHLGPRGLQLGAGRLQLGDVLGRQRRHGVACAVQLGAQGDTGGLGGFNMGGQLQGRRAGSVPVGLQGPQVTGGGEADHAAPPVSAMSRRV